MQAQYATIIGMNGMSSWNRCPVTFMLWSTSMHCQSGDLMMASLKQLTTENLGERKSISMWHCYLWAQEVLFSKSHVVRKDTKGLDKVNKPKNYFKY